MPPKHFEQDKYRNVEGILKVVREGLCHRCGACIGFCPVGTFGVDRDGYPCKVADCIQCNICVQACSGLAVDYDAIGCGLFGPDYRFGALMGSVRGACIANATNREVRTAGASGGVVTQILIHLLETGRIKGALVTVGNPDEPSQGKGIIARTQDDLLRSAQSRYTTAPSLAALLDIRNEDGPFALVGLPCQVHAVRRRQLADPRWRKRVPYLIGLLCHYNIPFTATREAAAMLAPAGARLVRAFSRQRDATGWPNNTLELWYSDGSKWRSPVGPAQIFNILSRVSKLGRCLTCMDATAEFSDISIGDPWIRNDRGGWKYEHPDGYSSVIVRTEQGEALLREAQHAGKIELRPIPPAEIEAGQHAMITEKKRRVAFRIKVRRLLGRPIPSYSVPLAKPSWSDIRKEIAFSTTRLLPVFGPVRRFFLRFALSPAGLWLVRRRIEQRRRRAAAGKARLVDSDFGDRLEKDA